MIEVFVFLENLQCEASVCLIQLFVPNLGRQLISSSIKAIQQESKLTAVVRISCGLVISNVSYQKTFSTEATNLQSTFRAQLDAPE